jgi:uncharacterized protein (TIGR02271 family)
MIDSTTIDRVIGTTAYDSTGDKLGKVGQVYVDTDSGRPLWASVNTGLFGISESFVPLENATFEGDELRVAYEKDRVKDAPRVEADREISEEEQSQLWEYYGLSGGSSMNDYDTTGTTGGFDRSSEFDTTRGAGHDTSGPNTDDAMTRSEEELSVGKRSVETGRARLRKHIVTENQTVTVPVEREEVRLEREPITEANIGDAMRGGDLTEEEHEVTLHEEQVVVDKKTVPVERVRVGTETHVENERVSEDVRKEQIDFDKDSSL